MRDAKKTIDAMDDSQFVAAKIRYAEESARTDREGGDRNGVSAIKYWHGWLDTMDRAEFAAEMATIDEEAYLRYLLEGSG